MNELSKLTTQHYENNEAGASLLSKVAKALDSLPDAVDPAQLAGLDQFHVMGLAAAEQLARIAGIERGAAILDAGSGLGGPSRYLAGTYGCRIIGVDVSPSFVAVAELLAQRSGSNALVSYQVADLLSLPFPDVVWTQHGSKHSRRTCSFCYGSVQRTVHGAERGFHVRRSSLPQRARETHKSS